MLDGNWDSKGFQVIHMMGCLKFMTLFPLVCEVTNKTLTKIEPFIFRVFSFIFYLLQFLHKTNLSSGRFLDSTELQTRLSSCCLFTDTFLRIAAGRIEPGRRITRTSSLAHPHTVGCSQAGPAPVVWLAPTPKAQTMSWKTEKQRLRNEVTVSFLKYFLSNETFGPAAIHPPTRICLLLLSPSVRSRTGPHHPPSTLSVWPPGTSGQEKLRSRPAQDFSGPWADFYLWPFHPHNNMATPDTLSFLSCSIRLTSIISMFCNYIMS